MENLKITSKTGEVLYDSALIAGVEDPQDFDDPDYELEDEEEDDELDSQSQENSQQDRDEVDPNKVYEDVQPEEQDPIQLDPGTAPVQANEAGDQEPEPTLRGSTRAR